MSKISNILPVREETHGSVPKGSGLVPDSVLQDKDPNATTVLCMRCRVPLYKIHLRFNEWGVLVSTFTEMLGPKMDPNEPPCPHCKGPYYDVKKSGQHPKYLTSKGIM